MHRVHRLLAARRAVALGCASLTAATAFSAAGDAAPPGCAAPPGSAPLHPRLVVANSRATTLLFTRLRDRESSSRAFAHAADRLMTLLAEEGLAHLPGVRARSVETPCGAFSGLEGVEDARITAVSIVRSGDILLEAVRKAAPGCSVGKILIQRDEASPLKEPRLIYAKLPAAVRDPNQVVLLVDPMLATGGSCSMAIRELVRLGVAEERIVFLNVVSCPEGLRVLAREHPQVLVITAAVDDGLNAQSYIVPGLGDFGDRYFGTCE